MKSIHPLCKAAGILLPTIALMALRQPLLNMAVFGCSVALLCASRVNAKLLCSSVLPVVALAAGLFLTGYRFHSADGLPVNAGSLGLTDSAVWSGLTLASRALAFAGLGLLFTLTTDRVRLVRSLHSQLHLNAVFAYGLLAAWGIVPQMLREYRLTRAGFAARGIRTMPFSPQLLLPLLVKSVRWSEALSIAMESKGFSQEAARSCFHPDRPTLRDWMFAALCCAGFGALLWLCKTVS